jgi:hypothetical protein
MKSGQIDLNKSNNMGYYIGINTGDLEDTVEDYIIKNSLDGDPDDLWSQNGWGFFEELSTITYDNEALFSDLELDGITTIIPSTNPNFSKFIDICCEYGAVFFNEKHQEIAQDQWRKHVVDSIACTISIAECEPEG